MSTNLKVAATVVAVVALGIVTWQLLPGPAGTGGDPSPTPTIAPSPTPTPTVAPTPTPAPTAAPLTGTHQSGMFGLTLSYPAGWTVRAATEPRTTLGVPNFGETTADFIYEPALEAHLFLGVTSQSLDGQSGSAWAEALSAVPDPEPCPSSEPITVAGAEGILITCDEPLRVFFWTEDQGYVVLLYRSGDEGWLEDVYDLAWFNEVLGTVQVQ